MADEQHGETANPALEKRRRKILDDAPPPAFWMLGKAQSGKSSIVRYMTGADGAIVGNGFRACTTHAQEFDFPSPADPLLRFLDTRGLGEISYDPAEDLHVFGARTHAVLVVVRLTDFAQDAVAAALREIRENNPKRPVVLVLTCLHQAMSGTPLPAYPFRDGVDSPAAPEPWRRAISAHMGRFAGQFDEVVPLDLTDPSEGFAEPNYGGERLKAILDRLLPGAYVQSLSGMAGNIEALRQLSYEEAAGYINWWAGAAAFAGAIPIPFAAVPAVLGIQAHLVGRIAAAYRLENTWIRLFAALGFAGGGGLMVALRQLLVRMVPGAGMFLGGSAAYAATYALGHAACWYFGQVLGGHEPSPGEMAEVLRRKKQAGDTAAEARSTAGSGDSR